MAGARARPRARSRCARSRDERAAERERFLGSPTIRVDGRDIQPPGDEPGRANLPRLPAARRAHLGAAGSRRRRATRSRAATEGGATMTPGELEIGDRRRRSSSRTPSGALTHACPLPARRRRRSSSGPATTARTRSPGTTGSSTSRATTPTAACASSPSTPTTPSATRPTRSRRCASGSSARSWPFPYLHDADQEAARAWGAADDPARVRPRLATCGCATRAPRTPTTRTPRRTRPGCAARSTRCSPARAASRPRPSRSAARSSGSLGR